MIDVLHRSEEEPKPEMPLSVPSMAAADLLSSSSLLPFDINLV